MSLAPSHFLLAHFDRLPEAPGGIARLRALILQLAVTGKLLPQSRDDESATKLLARIRTEKVQFTKKLMPTTSIDHSEIETEIPAEWEWIKLGDLCSKTGSGSTPRGGKTAYTASGIPFLRSQNVYNDGLKMHGVAYITPEIHAQMSGTVVIPRDLLLNITGGSIGRCTIVPDTFTEGNVSQHVAILRPAITGVSAYLHLVILSPHFQKIMLGSQTGAGREGLPKNRMDEILIPLPPLAEQRRIVAKVAELMSLCDTLETAQRERKSVRTRLRTSALHQLDSLDSDSKSVAFVLDHFPLLSNEPEDLGEIRRLVHLLAVQGMLVAQDPNEKPASQSVAVVEAAAKKAIRDGIIRKHGLTEPADDSELSEIPPGWRWSRLAEVTQPEPYAIKRGPFGSAIRKDMFVAKGFKIYEQQHAISGDFTRGRYYITEAKFEELSAFELHANEILVSCSGTVGKVAIVPSNIERGIINQALLKLSLHQSALLNEYFLILFPAFFMETETLTDLQGTAQKNIPGMDVLRAMPFPLPPLSEQRRIVTKVDELMAVLDALEATLATARTTSERLLAATIARLNNPAESEPSVLMAAENAGCSGRH